jgi:hypothetical protein
MQLRTRIAKDADDIRGVMLLFNINEASVSDIRILLILRHNST